MSRRGIGLDIGTTAVRAVQVSSHRAGPTLEKFGAVPLPEGAVSDGVVADVETVAGAVSELWSEAQLDGRRVALGVANRDVVVQQVDLPAGQHHQLTQSLAAHADDRVEMPTDDALLDFHALEEFSTGSGERMVRGLLVAATHEMVTAAVSATQQAGLSPVLVDLDAFALLRSVGSVHSTGSAAEAATGGAVEALVDVGTAVSNVVVHRRGVPQFVRILPLGSDTEPGVPTVTTMPAGQPTPPALLDAVRSALEESVRADLPAPIERIKLTGDGAFLPDLPGRLQFATRTPVEPGHPLAALRTGHLDPEQVARFDPLAAVGVGLALGAAA